MSADRVGESYTTVADPPVDYYETLVVGTNIWMFAKKYVEQPTYNWGHRPISAGGYAISYCTATNTWGDKKEYPSLCDDENAEELLTVIDDTIYLIIYQSYGAFNIKGMFQWNTQSWEGVMIDQRFPSLPAYDEKTRIDAIVSDGEHDDHSAYIVAKISSESMHVFKVHASGIFDNIATVAVAEVTKFPNAQAVSAAAIGGKLFIFFAVHGCVFRWENKSLIVVDLNSNNAEAMTIPGEYQEGPQCSFTGAEGRGVFDNEWIHAGGSKLAGMHNSEPYHSVWKLTNLPGSPEWKHLADDMPEGIPVVVNGRIFILGKDGTYRINAQ